MSTVELELKNSLNLKFNWKKVSKLRNTARRPASKMSKLGKRSANRSSPTLIEAPEVPEYEKPHRAASRRQCSASIEHVPIKKRRLLLRSPSPPTSSAPHPIGSLELHDGPYHVDRQVPLDLVVGRENIETDSSNVEGAIHSGSGEIGNSTSEVGGHNEDFYGIVMLADAACSGCLDNSSDDPGRCARTVAVVIQEQVESSSVAVRNGISGSSEFSGSLKKLQDESTLVVDRDKAAESFVMSDSVANVHRKIDGSVVLLSNDCTKSSDTDKTAEETNRSSGGSRDDRLHWDLNVVMGELEEPLDDTTANSGLNCVERTTVDFLQNQNPVNDDYPNVHDDSGKSETSSELTLLPSLCKLARSKILSNISPGTLVLNSKENVLDALSGPERSFIKDGSISSSTMCHTLETSNLFDSEVLACMKTRIAGVGDTLHLQSDDLKTHIPVDNLMTEADKRTIELIGGSSVCSVDVAQAEKLCVKVKAETSDFTSQPEEPYPTLVETREIEFFHGSESVKAVVEPDAAICKDIIDHGEQNIVNDSVNELGKVSYQTEESCTMGGVITANKLESLSLTVCKSEDVSLSAVAAQSDPPVEDGDVIQIIESPNAVNPSNISMPVHQTADEAYPDLVDIPASNTGKSHTKDLLDGELDSYIAHEDHNRGGSAFEVEGGYDSHLEDGELREPAGLLWGGNEGEEAEHVDYGSDNRDGCDTTDHPVLYLEKDLRGVGNKQSRSLSNQCNYNDGQSTSVKSTSRCGCCSISVSFSAVESEQLKQKKIENCIKGGKKTGVGSYGFSMHEIDSSENVGYTSAGVVGVATPRRELQSQIEGPVSSDVKIADTVQRDSSNNTSMHDGDKRQTDFDVSMGKGRTSFHRDDRELGNRSWNHAIESAVGKSVVADIDTVLRSSKGTSLGVRTSTIISTSRSSGCSHFARKGLTAENDVKYGSGKIKMRDVSPDNANRGRFDLYTVTNNRGCREGYRRLGIYESTNSTGALRNNFGRRERNFSPICNRVDHLHQGHRTSRSRSRSHSPDFRSEDRIRRMRIPCRPNNNSADRLRDLRNRRSPLARMFIQGPRFNAMGSPRRLRADDYIRPLMRPVKFSDMTSSGRTYEFGEDDEFKGKTYLPRIRRRSRSRSRTRSPEFRSEARMGPMRAPYQPCSVSHTRERRSPIRVFHPGQRFHNVASPVRTRSDDYVRPIMRPVKFSDSSQSGRRNEYEGDEFRRKPQRLFERIHPTRHYEMDDEVRHYRCETEDNDVEQNFRGTERRSGDIPRSNREERASTRYNFSDRVCYSGPKAHAGLQ